MITTDLASIIQGAGIATLGTNMWLGFMPDNPTTSIALYQKSGYVPMQLQSTVYGIERPELHVVVRSDSYDNVMSKANDVMKALHNLADQVINGHRYLHVRCLGSPTFLYADYSNKDPHQFAVVDFVVVKEFE
jgi:hypothetical protein